MAVTINWFYYTYTRLLKYNKFEIELGKKGTILMYLYSSENSTPVFVWVKNNGGGSL